MTACAQAPDRPARVVLLSIDAGADWIVDRLIEEGTAPAFARLMREGTSADAMTAAMPTLTAVAHATLWTGAPSRVHGVVGNEVSRLPRAAHTVLETRSGFDSDPLVAEPIWTAAARAGRRVLVLQATGGFPFSGAYPDRLLQFDVYANQLFDGGDVKGRLVDGRFTFRIGDGDAVVTRADGGLSVAIGDDEVKLAPGLDGRFSRPVRIAAGGATAAARFRLVSFDATTGDFRLRHGVGARITSSHPARVADFVAAAGALVGESVSNDYREGLLGPTIADGGSGEAERWLEDHLRANQEYFQGALRFAAREPWDLLVVYVSNFDAALHALGGMIDRAGPNFQPAIAARAWPFVERLFSSAADDFVADIHRHFPDAVLVVTADHGIEGTRYVVHPNVALRKAGLLTLDARGAIDLARTNACVPPGKGNMIFVNTVDWKAGIVPLDRRAEVARRAAAAVLSIRGPDGAPAIRAVFDMATDGPGLGIGGDAAGDLIFDTSPGYYARATATGDAEVEATARVGRGDHGTAPWRRGMHAIFYAAGPTIASGRRLPMISSVDVAPTVAALLGVPPPANNVGQALTLR
jgi:predicted AlkP superfamily pyrophosphatase or phosphodiesterase